MNFKEYLNLKSIGLIEFKSLFHYIEKNILDDLSTYKLINESKLDIGKSDTKKIILHNLIFGICEEIIKYKLGKKCVLVVHEDFLKNSEIIKYIDSEEIFIFLETILRQISRLLPIPVMFINTDVLTMDNNTGEAMEFKCILLSKLNELDNKNYSFRKIRKFCADNGLTFLTSEYFNKINSHQMLI